MKTPSEAWWASARRARDQLAERLLTYPNVSMIDIGLDPQGISDTPVLRVHIRWGDGSTLSIPDQIGDIPIRVVRGDYDLQAGADDL